MLQVIQNNRSGEVRLAEVPDPLAAPGHVLIANCCSVLSAGTEKSMLELGRMSLIGKARQRPDLVRRVIEKMRTEGVFEALSQAMRKLDEPMPLGYCSAGIVLAAGAGVQEYKPGDRVASNGPHAGVVCVPKHLCGRIADGTPLEHAAFAVLGSIALQGVRLGRVGLGETAFVVGLGLIGQIAVALLKLHGARVIGTDPDPPKCELAIRMGAATARPNMSAAEVVSLTRGLGSDLVLITASTKSDGPIALAGEAVRPKGRVVAVGAVGLNLPRRPFYFKEAEFVVSCSYGPGRYDPGYEDAGHDYPIGHVRWTEQRNIQTILDLMGTGQLDVSPLVTHRFPIDRAEEAYALISGDKEKYLGIILDYPAYTESRRTSRVELKPTAITGEIGLGMLGAGNFARGMLLPAIQKCPRLRPRVLCSGKGLSAVHAGRGMGFESATADEDEVFRDSEVAAVLIATRHDQHAGQVIKALRAGKHVFVEKPLALTIDEIEAIEAERNDRIVMVGFNRRFSPAARRVREFFARIASPLTVSIRFNAGEIPATHWTQDELVGGGRLIGEACHAIDLAVYLTGSLPVRVFAESIGGPNAPAVTDDQCFLTLRHANGSISSIGYLAGGDRAFPKERVEVLGGGAMAVIDDFRDVALSIRGSMKRQRAWKQDKGHLREIAAFADAIGAGGPSPIPWAELRGVSLASILAVRSLREQTPMDVPMDVPTHGPAREPQ